MKMGKLVASSNRLRKINARLVKVVKYKTGVDPQGIPTAAARTYTPNEYKLGRIRRSKDQNRYVSSVKYLNKQLNVKVSCSCPDYMFRWEYANAQVGAADIIYGNGEPPTDTNPDQKIGLCIAQGTLVTIKRGNQIMDVPIEAVMIGDRARTINGYQLVLAAEHTGYKDVSELSTASGVKVLLTPEHPVFAETDKGMAFVPAKDLVYGQKLMRLQTVGGQTGALVDTFVDLLHNSTMNVYDLKIEGEEHFTANTIVVHNCKHLLALRELIKKKHGI